MLLLVALGGVQALDLEAMASMLQTEIEEKEAECEELRKACQAHERQIRKVGVLRTAHLSLFSEAGPRGHVLSFPRELLSGGHSEDFPTARAGWLLACSSGLSCGMFDLERLQMEAAVDSLRLELQGCQSAQSQVSCPPRHTQAGGSVH